MWREGDHLAFERQFQVIDGWPPKILGIAPSGMDGCGDRTGSETISGAGGAGTPGCQFVEQGLIGVAGSDEDYGIAGEWRLFTSEHA